MSKLTNFNSFNPTTHKNNVDAKKRMVKENTEMSFPATGGIESSVLQNLYHISKKSMEIHDSIKNTEGEQIPEWILEIVASLNDRMNTVIDYMGYQTAMASGETGDLTDTEPSAIDLDQKEDAEDMEDETEMSTPIAMLETPEGEEEDSDEEETDDELEALEENVRFKYFENPMTLKPFKR